MLKIWKTAADFQNVLWCNVCLFSSVVLLSLLNISKEWIQISPCKYRCCSSQKDEIVVFSSKKITFRENVITRQAVQPPCFLLVRTQSPAHWHQKLHIKWYGSIRSVFLVQKSAIPFVRKKNFRKFHSNAKRSLFSLFAFSVFRVKVKHCLTPRKRV